MNISKKLMGLLFAGVVFTSLPYAYSAKGSAGAAASAEESAENEVYQRAINKAFLQAVYAGNAEEVDRCLEFGADVNTENELKESPIIVASEKNYVEVVKVLLYAGANINATDGSGWWPLISASACGAKAVVELLISKGVDLDKQQDDGGFTALIFASRNGNAGIVEVLLEAGAKVDIENEFGDTALTSACSLILNGRHDDHVAVVDKLLSYGAAVDHANHGGYTALMGASQCFRGSVALVEALVGAGATIDKDNRDEDALFLAIMAKKKDVVEFLISCKAGRRGAYKLDKCFVFPGGNPVEVLKILRENHIAFDLTVNAIHDLLQQGYFDAAEVLIENGVDLCEVAEGMSLNKRAQDFIEGVKKERNNVEESALCDSAADAGVASGGGAAAGGSSSS